MQKTLSALSQHQCGLFRAPLLLILPNSLIRLPSTDIRYGNCLFCCGWYEIACLSLTLLVQTQ
ncbi:hypothetical protein yrohd0001_17320 [Yersinia rohdei ATCC 43380]|nr:hypothetical protein yrohd0001_17320 [Yersinia rohdei ATCC 43380]